MVNSLIDRVDLVMHYFFMETQNFSYPYPRVLTNEFQAAIKPNKIPKNTTVKIIKRMTPFLSSGPISLFRFSPPRI